MTKVPSYFFCEKFCESCSSMYFPKEEKKRVEKQVCSTETDGTLLYQYRKSVVPPFDPFDNEEWKISKQNGFWPPPALLCSFFDPLGLSFKLFFLLLPFFSYERTSFFSRCIYSQIGKNVPFLSFGEIPLSELTLSKGKVSMLPLNNQCTRYIALL